MSVLSILAFVVLLVLLIAVSLLRNRANTLLYEKLHPPKKEQEEFLKACELYLEYAGAPQEHPDPAADAKYDAAKWMQEAGFLPVSFDRLPRQMAEMNKKRVLMRASGHPAYLTYDAIRTVSRDAFLECRKQDQLLSGYSKDPRFWDGGTFNPVAWKAYCAEMDAAFDQMTERFRQEADAAEKAPRMDG